MRWIGFLLLGLTRSLASGTKGSHRRLLDATQVQPVEAAASSDFGRWLSNLVSAIAIKFDLEGLLTPPLGEAEQCQQWLECEGPAPMVHTPYEIQETKREDLGIATQAAVPCLECAFSMLPTNVLLVAPSFDRLLYASAHVGDLTLVTSSKATKMGVPLLYAVCATGVSEHVHVFAFEPDPAKARWSVRDFESFVRHQLQSELQTALQQVSEHQQKSAALATNAKHTKQQLEQLQTQLQQEEARLVETSDLLREANIAKERLSADFQQQVQTLEAKLRDTQELQEETQEQAQAIEAKLEHTRTQLQAKETVEGQLRTELARSEKRVRTLQPKKRHHKAVQTVPPTVHEMATDTGDKDTTLPEFIREWAPRNPRIPAHFDYTLCMFLKPTDDDVLDGGTGTCVDVPTFLFKSNTQQLQRWFIAVSPEVLAESLDEASEITLSEDGLLDPTRLFLRVFPFSVNDEREWLLRVSSHSLAQGQSVRQKHVRAQQRLGKVPSEEKHLVRQFQRHVSEIAHELTILRLTSASTIMVDTILLRPIWSAPFAYLLAPQHEAMSSKGLSHQSLSHGHEDFWFDFASMKKHKTSQLSLVFAPSPAFANATEKLNIGVRVALLSSPTKTGGSEFGVYGRRFLQTELEQDALDGRIYVKVRELPFSGQLLTTKEEMLMCRTYWSLPNFR
ncbi:MAG: hypothetical protein MHM6MM_004271 [Cercozoa sp. M6MM]